MKTLTSMVLAALLAASPAVADPRPRVEWFASMTTDTDSTSLPISAAGRSFPLPRELAIAGWDCRVTKRTSAPQWATQGVVCSLNGIPVKKAFAVCSTGYSDFDSAMTTVRIVGVTVSVSVSCETGRRDRK